ncbi:MAG TPA: hypothetical protein VFR94_16020 [Nitrososphaeraceae archaeon]|nr:hypothetical protein [Nitrososphaeraceae archaeon]
MEKANKSVAAPSITSIIKKDQPSPDYSPSTDLAGNNLSYFVFAITLRPLEFGCTAAPV